MHGGGIKECGQRQALQMMNHSNWDTTRFFLRPHHQKVLLILIPVLFVLTIIAQPCFLLSFFGCLQLVARCPLTARLIASGGPDEGTALETPRTTGAQSIQSQQGQ
jgi:hypothetical protein